MSNRSTAAQVDEAIAGVCECNECNSCTDDGDVLKTEIERLRKIELAAMRVVATSMNGVDTGSEMARAIFGMTFVLQECGALPPEQVHGPLTPA